MKRIVFVLTGLLVGCASAPQHQPSQAPGWDEVVQIRHQKLAEARVMAAERCNFGWLQGSYVGAVLRGEEKADERTKRQVREYVSEKQVKCKQAAIALEREELMYAGMLRVMEKIAFPPSINVYHY